MMALEEKDLKEQGEQDWSKLPDDLRVDILCRLPEESLIAFKRVSKDWQCKPDPIGTYLDSLPFTCTTKNLQDCCNGFLLICRNDYEPAQYLVCNPATRQTVTIPVNPKHDQDSNLVDSSLLFDPSESLEYKIIRFVHSISKATIHLVDVFSSETGEWIEYQLSLEPPKVSGIGWLKNSVYLDGVLYKISVGGCLIRIDMRCNSNLVNLNAWATHEFPDQQQSNKYVGCIGASRGHLCYFNRNASHFFIWRLKNENGTQWILKHNISLYSLQHCVAGYYCTVMGDKVWSTIQPCVLPDLDDILLFETPWFLVTYKFKYNSFNFYTANFRTCETRRLGQSFPYSRSLVVLNSIINKHLGSPASFNKF